MINLNCPMILILFQIFKIISNSSLKSMKHKQQFLLLHVYSNKINERFVFKIKYGYKPELQTPETMKLFDSTKKLINKSKNGEKVPSLEKISVQCNLVDNQYQQSSEVLYTFTPNKCL